MSQNGPYPGPPWSSGSSDEPYTEPADPWGEQAGPAPEPAWGGHPTSMPPALESSVGYYPSQQYGAGALGDAPPIWAPPPPAPRRRNTPIVALVVVLGVLILGGLGTTAFLLSGKDRPGSRAADPAPTNPATAAANDPEPRSSEDARFVVKGQCVRNEGSTDTPDMKIVPCASGTYEVLKRVDGRTTGEADAESKCSKVPNYTKWYFYDSELDSLDFVLCLRERKAF
jgi:hypothetical protein